MWFYWIGLLTDEGKHWKVYKILPHYPDICALMFHVEPEFEIKLFFIVLRQNAWLLYLFPVWASHLLLAAYLPYPISADEIPAELAAFPGTTRARALHRVCVWRGWCHGWPCLPVSWGECVRPRCAQMSQNYALIWRDDRNSDDFKATCRARQVYLHLCHVTFNAVWSAER